MRNVSIKDVRHPSGSRLERGNELWATARLTDASILVVDDEASIVRLFVRAIQSAGYTHVHGTTDPTEVPALLDSLAPDLVVMDLNMPGLDGFGLLEEISGRLSQDTFLPVLTVSGMADPEAKDRAFRAGAKDYLTKPIGLPELILHVNSLLETRFLSLRLHDSYDRMEEVVGRRTEELRLSVAERQHAEELLHETERHFAEVRRLTRSGNLELGCGHGRRRLVARTLRHRRHATRRCPRPPLRSNRRSSPPTASPAWRRRWPSRSNRGLRMNWNSRCCGPMERRSSCWRAAGPCRTRAGRVVRIAGTLQDITERWRAQSALAETLERLRESEATIIRVLSSVVDRRDPYTAGHQRRVAEISVAIAHRMGLEEERVRGIETAALLHDLGKISIPLEILSCAAPLSPIQYSLVQEHVTIGYELLESVPFLEPIAQAILQHHERLDGSGYPAGIKGDEIILEAGYWPWPTSPNR